MRKATCPFPDRSAGSILCISHMVDVVARNPSYPYLFNARIAKEILITKNEIA